MIEFEEYKSKLNDLKPKLEELRAAFVPQSLLDELEHGGLDRRTIAQPDAAKGVEDEAAQHQSQGHRARDGVQDFCCCVHAFSLLSYKNLSISSALCSIALILSPDS